jgi:membrane protease YdiL (CAAX protease family)
MAIPVVVRVVPMELTGMDAALYAVLMAIAEENFFRGAITNFLLTITSPAFAILGSAMIFTAYHIAVYRTSLEAFIYVFVGGAVLAWVAQRTGRLSPAICAHIINNLLATLFVR